MKIFPFDHQEKYWDDRCCYLPPFDCSRSIISSLSPSNANSMRVPPSSSWLMGSAPAVRNAITSSGFSSLTAYHRAVQPPQSGWFTSHPFWSGQRIFFSLRPDFSSGKGIHQLGRKYTGCSQCVNGHDLKYTNVYQWIRAILGKKTVGGEQDFSKRYNVENSIAISCAINAPVHLKEYSSAFQRWFRIENLSITKGIIMVIFAGKVHSQALKLRGCVY